jgi:hypothetical protein
MRTVSLRNSTIRRTTLAIAGVAVIGTVAAGCGSSSKGGSAATLPTTSTTTAPSTPSQQPQTTTSPTEAPTSDSGSSTPGDDSGKAAAYKQVLLSASEVSDITGEEFTAEPSSDDTVSNSEEPSGCAALDDFVAASKDSEQGKATASFNNADQSQQAEEQLTYVPEQAETLFTQLKDALGSCDTLGAGQDQLTLAVQDDPEIQDADDTLAFTASATGSGKSIVVTGLVARFGDNIVQITYSAVGTEDNPIIGDTELLTQAASKAATALA